jgi:hypothetical protein
MLDAAHAPRTIMTESDEKLIVDVDLKDYSTPSGLKEDQI